MRSLWIVAAVLAMLVSRPGSAAEDGAPLIVLYGTSDDVTTVRAALEDFARRRGSVVLDRSPAKDPPPDAPVQLRRAISAYQELHFEPALAALDAGLAEASRRGAAGLTTAELADLFLYRALVRTAQGDSTSAWEDFLRAASIDPLRNLDPVRFPPSVVSTFERARETIKSQGLAEVTLERGPECKAWLDGRELPPDLALSVPPGDHFLRVTCQGRLPYEATLHLASGAQRVAPVLRERKPPSAEAVAKLAADRGFRHVVFARVEEDTAGGESTALLLLLTARGKELARTAAGLDKAPAAAVQTAIERLLERLEPVAIPTVPVTTPTPWYRQPWLWGAVGVATATAVLLPFVLSEDGASGFRVELGGTTP